MKKIFSPTGDSAVEFLVKEEPGRLKKSSCIILVVNLSFDFFLKPSKLVSFEGKQ